ncbi:HTH domain-containing protein [Haloarcula argentinensis]|uniref:Helix-turn-helix domain-containing protein n=1 Tax=Haloarcula argentinensis TaxID=43776 RepID=A0ABU2F5H9_HALAR|nr:HTH domain-containing protein [Haloarcula argentinensis]EMA26733.1 hypothetical protein C443_00152 [Haloarcula argentinensis DSM 12282]MDS0255824.1 helix-turn-helix domain-containing protein [Haloarcula argentinensis]
MAQVPSEFEEEFEAKKETFFGIAELLYANPDRQYTQQELADRFDCSTTTISNHTQEMSEWLDRRDGQTTYAWNVDVYDPGHTETTMAVQRFYTDLWWLLELHQSAVRFTGDVVDEPVGPLDLRPQSLASIQLTNPT